MSQDTFNYLKYLHGMERQFSVLEAGDQWEYEMVVDVSLLEETLL